MGSKFIKPKPGKPVECFSCGSSLLRRAETPSGREYVHCFVCGAGDIHLMKEEARGLDLQQALALVGREQGKNYQILPRLHSPGYTPSQTRFSEADLRILEDYLGED